MLCGYAGDSNSRVQNGSAADEGCSCAGGARYCLADTLEKLCCLAMQEIATAEGKKAALQMSAAAVREEQGLLQKELESLQLTVEAAKADVTNAQQNLRSLTDTVCTVHLV